MADRKRCCCNCGRNIRHEVESYGIECYCEIDGHRIGYIECFEGWCRRWKSDPGKDVRACVREADALGMSCGQYVAAGLDQVADAIGRDADEPTA